MAAGSCWSTRRNKASKGDGDRGEYQDEANGDSASTGDRNARAEAGRTHGRTGSKHVKQKHGGNVVPRLPPSGGWEECCDAGPRTRTLVL